MTRFVRAELAARARMIAGLAAGAAVFMLILGLAYHSIGGALGDAFGGAPPKAITAFSGSHSGDVLSPRGWMGFGFDHPMMLITSLTAAISIGAGVIAGEVDTGRAQMLFSRPVARTRFLLAGLAVWLAAELAVLAVALAGSFAGALLSADLRHASLGGMAWAPVQLLPLTLFVMSTACLASALSDTRTRALGIAIGVTVLAYLVNVVSGLLDAVYWLRWCTPFGYYDPTAAIEHGPRPWPLVALAGASALLLLAARTALERRDLA
ncbi:MAG TPA: ABC transporter permease subunit [Solirubrobacteraceae bacterium]|jgi:ABC-2 type transport system permease protein|nr:ABC transporter permease subunit [Solirubrobacteraceae bacterium]